MNVSPAGALQNLLKHIKQSSLSLRRRFALYVVALVAMVLSFVFLLLNIFGIVNPANAQIMDTLDTHLRSYADSISKDYNQIAAYALSFSDQLENKIQDYMTANNLTFRELKNNADALTELQIQLYDTVYLNMQLAPSSGAFYILDTTVNSSMETPYYNGIYLKYVNLSSENTVNNDFALYRGSFSAGKTANITFHSGWKNEMQTDFFERSNALFENGRYYILSPVVDIPDTWEQARYVYVPIRDIRDDIIGVCGFEVSNLFFQLSQKISSDEFDHLVCGLLDESSGTYTGQFSSGRYHVSQGDPLYLTEERGGTVFHFDSEICIGKTRKVDLGGSTFTVSLMLPDVLFHSYVLQGQIRIIGIIAIVVLFAFVCCLVMSKNYVAPIIKKIDSVKSNLETERVLGIREIDDLFTYLEERDALHDAQLRSLEDARNKAEIEAQRSRLAYEKALEEYELAQNQIHQLSGAHKKEIVLEDYEYFICNLASLTPTESRIYELYLEGKNAVQIAEIIGIKENTMKYHNKNIYSKLGISSRKQLLRFAALKQHRDQYTDTMS